MPSDGYVKFYRCAVDGGWLKDAKLWTFWSWCLFKATHRPIKILVGLQEVRLEPGQFIFGRKAAAEELEMNENSIRARVAFLQDCGNITLKTTNKFSIITIVNWARYQQEGFNDHQQPTNNPPTNHHKQESITSTVHKKKKSTYVPSNEFEAFWTLYPKKVGKGNAWRVWQSMNGTRPDHDTLARAIERQRAGRQWQEGYIKDPERWLRGRHWEDQVDPVAPVIATRREESAEEWARRLAQKHKESLQ